MDKKGKACAHRSNNKNDNLPTPFSMTLHLLNNEYFNQDKIFFEPASGEQMAIVQVFANWYVEYEYGDINNGQDFFQQTKKYDYIITNPPFSKWDEFIQKAKTIAIDKFAFLGDMDFLTGIDRYRNKLYFDGEYGLCRVWEFVRKCDLRHEFREDGKYPAGMQHYGWYIFEKGWKKNYYEGRWLNNQNDILSSKESTCTCKICEDEKNKKILEKIEKEKIKRKLNV
jgi:hypothetical protein